MDEITEADLRAEFAEQMAIARDEWERKFEENLDSLDAMLDHGWRALYGGAFEDREGPTLQQVKDAATRNREMSLNPHVGGGLELIYAYVWGTDIHYDGISRERRGRKKGVGTVWDKIENPINQQEFFSTVARKQRQAAYYYDGQVLYAGNDDDSTLQHISIKNIGDDYRNPNRADEIWAYRYEWTEHRLDGPARARVEWIFSSRHMDKIKGRKFLTYHGQREPIATNKRMFVAKSNPIVGWAYGTADVQRGISWAEDYRQAMLDGKKMNAAMASIWATMKKNTLAAAQDTAIKLGQSTVAGRAAMIGQNNDIMAMTTAGQAYDFQKLLPLLANFAAGIGVSAVALSMNSGNAGGSYGAAKTLDGPERVMTNRRRGMAVELDREVLIWLGADKDELDVWFDPIMDPTEKYRAEQGIELRLGTGLYEGDEIKRMHAQLDNRNPEKVTPVPNGWLIPQNKNSIELRQIDPNTNKSDPAGGKSASNGGGFTPTQGSGAKTVKSGSGDQKGDDVRTNREAFGEMVWKLTGQRLTVAELEEAYTELFGRES
jgi:hypothetical protein